MFGCCAGENWNSVMYDGMRTTKPYAALYFLFIVIIGNYVVLNLFLAILLDKFATGSEKEDPPRQCLASEESVHLSGLAEESEEDHEDAVKSSRATYLLGLHVRTEQMQHALGLDWCIDPDFPQLKFCMHLHASVCTLSAVTVHAISHNGYF
jgi:hypothetical protein